MGPVIGGLLAENEHGFMLVAGLCVVMFLMDMGWFGFIFKILSMNFIFILNNFSGKKSNKPQYAHALLQRFLFYHFLFLDLEYFISNCFLHVIVY